MAREKQNLPVIFLAFANDRDDRARYLRNLPEELRQVRERLEQAESAGLCEVVVRTNTTIRELLDVFQDGAYRDRIAIFHFGGHAGGYELLMESAEGSPEFAHAEGLAAFLGQQRGLRLVFLNGCSTEPQVEGLLTANVPAVVATSEEIADAIATELSVRFYNGLSSGVSLHTAYNEAVAAVKTQTSTREPTRSLDPRGVRHVQDVPADRWPWELYVKPGADAVRDWSLPDAAGDPLFGLPPLPEGDLPDTPFRHLQWFRLEDAEIFFGRGREIREFYELATSESAAPLLLFYGQSGVGKSSLLAAGVLPRLDATHEVRYTRRDGERGLAASLCHALTGEGSGPVAEAWRAMEAESEEPVTVILDQLEEVFTRPLSDQHDEFENFLDIVTDCFADRATRPRGKLVLVFRKEWLADIEERVRERTLPRSKLFLERLDRDGIIEIVHGPAEAERLRQAYRLDVEPGLGEMIAADLLEDPDAPIAPTLQILLTKLWEKAAASDVDAPRFTVELYQTLRRQGLLLDDFLEVQLAAVRSWDRKVVDSGLALDLLGFHTTSLGTSELRTPAELESVYSHQTNVLRSLVQQTKDHYLLVDHIGQEEFYAGGATRLAHDTLAPLVRRRFKDSDLPGQRARRVIESRAVDWADGQTGPPLDGADLSTVEAGADGMRVPTADEERLIAASRKQRSVVRRQRRMGIGLLVAAVLAIAGLATWGWISQHRAKQREQETRSALASADLLKAAELSRSGQNPRSLAYLARALRLNPEGSAARSLILKQLMAGRALGPLALGNPLEHEGPVLDAMFSPDGRRVLTATNRAARVWDLETRALVGELLSGDRVFRSARFSPDGERVVTASDDSTARVWNVRWGTTVGKQFVHGDRVHFAEFSPDGQRVVTASWDRTARVWDIGSGKTVGKPLMHAGAVYYAEFSPDGRRVLTASDSSGHLWDAESGTVVGEPLEHGARLNSATFSSDGKLVVTAAADGTAIVWDADTGIPVADPLTHGSGILRSAVFIPDRRRVITVASDGTARVWDAETGAAIGKPLTHGPVVRRNVRQVGAPEQEADRIIAKLMSQAKRAISKERSRRAASLVAVGPDGLRVVTASNIGRVYVWNTETGAVVGEPLLNDTVVNAVAYSPDGRFVVTASDDGKARLWEVRTKSVLSLPLVHDSLVFSAEFSPDGRRVITVSRQNAVQVWDAGTGAETGPSFAHPGRAYLAEFSPDGRRVVTAANDSTARVWDADTGAQVGLPLVHRARVTSATFSPDGRWVVTSSSDSTARVWDSQTGAPVGTPLRHDSYVGSAVFSPNGRQVVTASWDKTARVWDAETGTPVGQPFVHGGRVNSAMFSPDGRRVVTTSADGAARVWNVATSAPEGQPFLPGNPYAAFSPDGRRLVTSSGQVARVWNVKTGAPLGQLVVSAGLRSAEFSPDGRRVVTAANDSTAWVWDAETGAAIVDPLKHDYEYVYSAVFSPDGQRVVTTSGDGIARVWDVFIDGRKGLPALESLAEAVGGYRIDERASVQVITDGRRRAILDSLRTATTHATRDEGLRWFVRWVLDDPATRTISPLSRVTVEEWIQGRLEEGRIEEAARAFPGHPLLLTATETADQQE